ncbi:SH3 domain-containing protein [Gemmobacter fulvus]|uniref:SH3 domain-containing protein n=1 Tax=Gemmobacter fulvus TaxID=2840474 RepID=UPI00279666F6|nr:SH3 domain-containing protein [Gemmobacter fulvus]MDQ1846870.1 SH3 domain-containing protein [Gemmobacter fulvus]
MRKVIFAVLAAAVVGTLGTAAPATAGPGRYYEVTGVDEDDMLKMRAGPGIGYRVIVGLPNGTLLRVYSCEQSGGTRWCKVALKQARGLEGYVSWAYLREN